MSPQNPITPRDELAKKVIGLAMRVHSALGPGFLEIVYRNALVYELNQANIACETERFLKVYYGDITVGVFKVDLLIEKWLVCELKSVPTLNIEHEAQLINYLTAINHDFGLLLNFGTKSLEVKRKYKRRAHGEPPDLRGG